MPHSGDSQGSSSTSERVYGKLFSACPKEFRENHGPQMMQAFGDLCREERHKGRLGSAKLWAKAIPDLVTTAILERSRVVAVQNLPPWRERVGMLDVIVAFVLSFFLAMIAVVIFFSINPGAWDISWDQLSLSWLTTLYLSLNLAVILVVWLMTSVSSVKITTRSIGLRRVSAWWLFVGAALGLTCWAVAGVAGALYFWVTGNVFYTAREEFFPGLSGASFLDLIFFWIASGLLTAMTNELLFRGILYTYLRRWGIGLAVSVSAAVFGLVCFAFNVELLVIISVGAVLALIYERSGSLWPAVTCAVAINTLARIIHEGS